MIVFVFACSTRRAFGIEHLSNPGPGLAGDGGMRVPRVFSQDAWKNHLDAADQQLDDHQRRPAGDGRREPLWKQQSLRDHDQSEQPAQQAERQTAPGHQPKRSHRARGGQPRPDPHRSPERIIPVPSVPMVVLNPHASKPRGRLNQESVNMRVRPLVAAARVGHLLADHLVGGTYTPLNLFKTRSRPCR